MVHRKAKAHAGQAGEIGFAFDAGLLHRILVEFEHDVSREILVGVHIIQELREEFLIGQRVGGDVAENANAAALVGQTAHDLDAAEQQKIVHHAHQAGGASHFHILQRHDHRAVFGAQPRQGFVVAQLSFGKLTMGCR